jgi:hypothetical protein
MVTEVTMFPLLLYTLTSEMGLDERKRRRRGDKCTLGRSRRGGNSENGDIIEK